MKNHLPAVLVLLCFHLFSFSQERQKITHLQGAFMDKYKEVYQVLTSDTAVKDGYYKSYINNKLRVEGFYSNAAKDSVWQEYMFDNNVYARKLYSHGNRTGKWQFFDRRGNAEWTYDFSEQKADYIKPPVFPDSTKFYYQTSNGEWIQAPLDKAPVALYGKEEFLMYMVHRLIYPQVAQKNNDQGTVIIAVTVDEQGQAIDYAVYKTAAATLSETALNLVKDFYHDFLPAEKDGKKVKSKYLVPVGFHLAT